MLDQPLRAKHLVGFLVLWILAHAVISVADNLTITTYYPSPYGVYDQLRTRRQTFLAVNPFFPGPAQKVVVGRSTILTPNPTNLWNSGSRMEVDGIVGVGQFGVNNLEVGRWGWVWDANNGGWQVGPAVESIGAGQSLHLQSASNRVYVGGRFPAAARNELIVNGTLRINANACREIIHDQTGIIVGPACNVTEYATWIPGIHIVSAVGQGMFTPASTVQRNDGTWWGAGFTVQSNFGDTFGGLQENPYNSTRVRSYCCPRAP